MSKFVPIGASCRNTLVGHIIDVMFARRGSVVRRCGWPIGLAALTVAGACTARGMSPAPARGDAGGKIPAPARPSLTLSLAAVQSTYHLRDGAKLKQQIEDAARFEKMGRPVGAGRRLAYPEPPAVDLLLTITNISKAALQMWNRNDDRGTLSLLLEGPGAVLATPIRLGMLKLRMDKPLMLGPGQTRTIRFTRLASGSSDDAFLAYWTSPGDYRVSVVWKTAIKPTNESEGKNADDDFSSLFDGQDWTPITLTSNAVTVQVTSP